MARRPARRRSSVPAKAPDWRAVERAAAAWDGLRIADADLDRVAAFLQTHRAHQLHAELVAFQNDLQRSLPHFDWTRVDAPTLLGLLVVAWGLIDARHRGFPPGTPADRLTERWLAILYRLILAGDGAGLPALSLAKRAMTAVRGRFGAWEELLARGRRHHVGFGAAVGALLRFADGDDRDVFGHIRNVADKQTPTDWRERTRWAIRRDELDSALGEEVARRLEGRHDEGGLLDAAIEALPPGLRGVSRWDFIARDVAQRIRRGIRPEEGRASVRDDARPNDDRIDLSADARPDLVAETRKFIAWIKAVPRRAAALEAMTTRQRRSAVAKKLGKSEATLRNAIADLRKEFSRFKRGER